MQLFDSPTSFADALCPFIHDGLVAGDSVLIVITARHLEQIRQVSLRHGIALDAACAAGQLVLLDADQCVREWLRGNEISFDDFAGAVRGALRDLRKNRPRVRVFGEAVDILVRRNDFDAAERLEACWNRLAESEPFELFCGYSSEHFGNPRDAASLQRICRLHSHVQTDGTDVLGSFLLKTSGAC
jgi:hypothetical protein